MIIILPNITKYSCPLDYLNTENVSFSEIYSKLEDTENIRLYLPKFSIDYKIVITSILVQMGFKSIFSSYVTNNLVKGENFRFSGTLVANYIEVDENGGEAGDVNLKDNSLNSNENKDNKDNIVMDVNHNFIFMVQSNQIKDSEGNYLMPFIGIVNKLEGTPYYKPTDKVESTDENLSTDGNKATDKDESTERNIPTDGNKATDKDESTERNIPTDGNKPTDRNIPTDGNKVTDKVESTDGNITIDDEPIKFEISLSNYFKINFTIIISLIILFL
jgi:hypothetical protein